MEIIFYKDDLRAKESTGALGPRRKTDFPEVEMVAAGRLGDQILYWKVPSYMEQHKQIHFNPGGWASANGLQ